MKTRSFLKDLLSQLQALLLGIARSYGHLQVAFLRFHHSHWTPRLSGRPLRIGNLLVPLLAAIEEVEETPSPVQTIFAEVHAKTDSGEQIHSSDQPPLRLAQPLRRYPRNVLLPVRNLGVGKLRRLSWPGMALIPQLLVRSSLVQQSRHTHVTRSPKGDMGAMSTSVLSPRRAWSSASELLIPSVKGFQGSRETHDWATHGSPDKRINRERQTSPFRVDPVPIPVSAARIPATLGLVQMLPRWIRDLLLSPYRDSDVRTKVLPKWVNKLPLRPLWGAGVTRNEGHFSIGPSLIQDGLRRSYPTEAPSIHVFRDAFPRQIARETRIRTVEDASSEHGIEPRHLRLTSLAPNLARVVSSILHTGPSPVARLPVTTPGQDRQGSAALNMSAWKRERPDSRSVTGPLVREQEDRPPVSGTIVAGPNDRPENFPGGITTEMRGPRPYHPLSVTGVLPSYLIAGRLGEAVTKLQRATASVITAMGFSTTQSQLTFRRQGPQMTRAVSAIHVKAIGGRASPIGTARGELLGSPAQTERSITSHDSPEQDFESIETGSSSRGIGRVSTMLRTLATVSVPLLAIYRSSSGPSRALLVSRFQEPSSYQAAAIVPYSMSEAPQRNLGKLVSAYAEAESVRTQHSLSMRPAPRPPPVVELPGDLKDSQANTHADSSTRSFLTAEMPLLDHFDSIMPRTMDMLPGPEGYSVPKVSGAESRIQELGDLRSKIARLLAEETRRYLADE